MKPSPKPLHIQTDLTGDLAAEVRRISEEAQVSAAAALRVLALDGLKARSKLRESA